MARSISEIEQELMALPGEDRARLARDLIVSLDDDVQKLSQQEWDEAWREEVQLREMEVREGRAQTYSVKDTLEELNNKYKK